MRAQRPVRDQARGHHRSRPGADEQTRTLVRQNVRLAKHMAAGRLRPVLLHRLRNLTTEFRLSLALGDLLYLEGG